MYVIRLMRLGVKKKPIFRIVAVYKKKARNGQAREYLGYYLPISRCNRVESVFIKNISRIGILKQHGAQISIRIVFLLKKYYNYIV